MEPHPTLHSPCRCRDFPEADYGRIEAPNPEGTSSPVLPSRRNSEIAPVGERGRSKGFEPLLREAEKLLKSEPTPEPSVKGSIRDPQTRKYWWPNREQTLKACMEAETLALAYLLTGEKRFGEAARKWILHLASWDPDGPTNFALNCEAAKPMLHRLPRAYDWAYDTLTEAEREKFVK